MDAHDECMKKRCGEGISGDEHERKCWFKAYNRLTMSKEGVSVGDFKLGDIVM